MVEPLLLPCFSEVCLRVQLFEMCQEFNGHGQNLGEEPGVGYIFERPHNDTSTNL